LDFSPDSLEEQMGFPTVFLAVGAATVMASFWAGNDISTRLLLANVYESMLKVGENLALALQRAGQSLRAMDRDQVIARLDDESPHIQAAREEVEAKRDNEGYVAATSALAYLRAERRRLTKMPADERPFAHPYLLGCVRRARGGKVLFAPCCGWCPRSQAARGEHMLNTQQSSMRRIATNTVQPQFCPKLTILVIVL
jgi:hypothetical protein